MKDTVVTNDRWGGDVMCKHGDFWTCTDRFNPGQILNISNYQWPLLNTWTWGLMTRYTQKLSLHICMLTFCISTLIFHVLFITLLLYTLVFLIILICVIIIRVLYPITTHIAFINTWSYWNIWSYMKLCRHLIKSYQKLWDGVPGFI